MEKTSSKQTLIDIATLVYDYFQGAKEELNRASNSHEASYGEGQCVLMEKLQGEVYWLIGESEDGEELMKEIHNYEQEQEEYQKKVAIIVEASDYELTAGCEDDDCVISDAIADLESQGVQISEENMDKIVEYMKNLEEV